MTTADQFSFKRDWICFAGIAIALLIYFPDVFLLKAGFLSGDHRAQHYPWQYTLAESVKHLRLPWWTSLFHSGFPLLAEGQVGAFYPFNLALYFFLPAFAGYSYGILFHYGLGGWIFYAYLRSLKLVRWACFFATLVYLFGTAQGGYFYNINSQKVLIWLPLCFYLCDQIISNGRKRYIFWLGAVMGIQLLAGYLQFALYSIGFTGFYFFWFAMCSAFRARRAIPLLFQLAGFAAAVGLSVWIALPQLASTWELSRSSMRFSYPVEFAFLGSLNPLAAATLFYPHWDGFLRNEFYVGAAGLFFLILSMATKKVEREIFFWVLFFTALALALGKYNPFYVFAVKATGFQAFRVPAKYLYFAAVSSAVLSGYGFHKWFCEEDSERSKKVFPVFALLTGAGMGGLFVANGIMHFFGPAIKGELRAYIQNHFIRSPIRTQPLEHYYSRLDAVYQDMMEGIRIFSRWNLCFLAFMALSLIFVWLASRATDRRRKKQSGYALGFIVILFANLYVYGMTSIKGNLEPYGFVEPPSRITEFLKQETQSFRLQRVISTIASSDEQPVIPHTNMLMRVPITGAYSPLMMADYFRFFAALGDVNDSQQLILTEPGALDKYAALADFMNVKYVLSDRSLSSGKYREILRENESRLYLNDDFMPRAFFVTRSTVMTDKQFSEELESGNFSPTRKVYLIDQDAAGGQGKNPEYFQALELSESDSHEHLGLKFETPSAGFLVVSDILYPGWKVFINGEQGEILRANGLFRAVTIPKAGQHHVQFEYEPRWKKWVPLSAGVFIFALVFPLMAGYVKSGKRA